MASWYWKCLGFRRLSRQQHSLPQVVKGIFGARVSTVVQHTIESGETVHYPALFDASWSGLRRRNLQEWYDAIRRMPTVEEKLQEISQKEIYVVMVENMSRHYGTLPLELFMTKTNLCRGLPDYYKNIDVDAAYEKIRPRLLVALKNAFSDVTMPSKPNEEHTVEDVERWKARMVIDEVTRTILMSLADEYPHLARAQIDYEPRREAFCFRSGFHPVPAKIEYRKRKNKKSEKWLKTIGRVVMVEQKVTNMYRDLDETVVDCCQFISNPYLQLRTAQPLPMLVNPEDDVCSEKHVHQQFYNARTFGYHFDCRYPTSVPGVWPSDPQGFGLLSFYTSEELIRRRSEFQGINLTDFIHGLAVTTSFSWLISLATNKGYTPYHELTYPITTQTVVTDGKIWSFYAYQLNSICLGRQVDSNLYCNVCWGTEPMQLFEDIRNGEIVGLNDDVFRLLLKFYLNKTQEISDVNLTPYLNEHNYSDEQWNEICTVFRRKYSNRPPYLKPEVPMWEKIYKRRFKTRLE